MTTEPADVPRWFVSRRIIWMRRTAYWVAGPHPYNQWALERGWLGDYVRDVLTGEQRRQRWPWWQLNMPEPLTRLYWAELRPLHELLGLLLAAYAIAKTLTRAAA